METTSIFYTVCGCTTSFLYQHIVTTQLHLTAFSWKHVYMLLIIHESCVTTAIVETSFGLLDHCLLTMLLSFTLCLNHSVSDIISYITSWIGFHCEFVSWLQRCPGQCAANTQCQVTGSHTALCCLLVTLQFPSCLCCRGVPAAEAFPLCYLVSGRLVQTQSGRPQWGALMRKQTGIVYINVGGGAFLNTWYHRCGDLWRLQSEAEQLI